MFVKQFLERNYFHTQKWINTLKKTLHSRFISQTKRRESSRCINRKHGNKSVIHLEAVSAIYFSTNLRNSQNDALTVCGAAIKYVCEKATYLGICFAFRETPTFNYTLSVLLQLVYEGGTFHKIQILQDCRQILLYTEKKSIFNSITRFTFRQMQHTSRLLNGHA